jgi:hypothetical protein
MINPAIFRQYDIRGMGKIDSEVAGLIGEVCPVSLEALKTETADKRRRTQTPFNTIRTIWLKG